MTSHGTTSDSSVDSNNMPKNSAGRRAISDKASSGGGDAKGNGVQQRSKSATNIEISQESLGSNFLVLAAVPSWLASMLLHIITILLLALVTFSIDKKDATRELTLNPPSEELEDMKLLDETPFQQIEVDATDLQSDVMPQTEVPIETEFPILSEEAGPDAASISVELDPWGQAFVPLNDLMQDLGVVAGNGLEGRSAETRARLVREGGGNEASELAVARALEWLAKHQNPNGSWSFTHLNRRCPCPNHGSLPNALNGATAMALLPFLGAGHTHKDGKHKETVNRGLYFLLNRQNPNNGSLYEPAGTMYSHGLASIVLCEAFAMTQDKNLQGPAQGAVNFIVYAQDPIGGGWRYAPQSPGDTSAVGWQLMALKSARMAYLQVPDRVFVGVTRFLNSVQLDGGSSYGYMGPGEKKSTSSIGLLCRMYLGWNRSHLSLERGLQRLARIGPDMGTQQDGMYYNYYATQVLHHCGGELWKEWNLEMRDWLVVQQSNKGHMKGSWFMKAMLNRHNDKGGRLYFTSMATMILEVYYRHMPLYGKQASPEEFQL